MPPAGFEPAIPASERPQTHFLDRVTTGIVSESLTHKKTETHLVARTQNILMLILLVRKANAALLWMKLWALRNEMQLAHNPF
jgi:hypothetical protein